MVKQKKDYGGLPEYILSVFEGCLSGGDLQTKQPGMNASQMQLVRQLYDPLPIGILLVDSSGDILFLNRHMKRLLMMDKFKAKAIGLQDLGRLPLTHSQRDGYFHITYPNRKIKSLEADSKLISIGKLSLLQFTFQDKTPLFEAVGSYEMLSDKYSAYMPHIGHPMFILSQDGICLDAISNRKLFFGIDMQKTIGKHIHEILPTDFSGMVLDAMALAKLESGYTFTYKYASDHTQYAYEVSLYKHANGESVCMARDVSELSTMVSSIEYLNEYDSLTDVYNRDHFDKILGTMGESHNSPLGIYAITLSGLNRHNRKAERGKAEDLMIDTAIAIKHACSQHDIPCRVSWDAFVVFLPNSTDEILGRFGKSFTQNSSHIAHTARQLMVSINERHCLIHHKEPNLMGVIEQLLG